MRDLWSRLGGPLKIGLVIGLVGALLTVIGIFKGGFAPLTLRSLLLGILLGGGSWGLVSWAIASAAVDAVSPAVDAVSPAVSEEPGPGAGDAAAGPAAEPPAG